MSEPQFSRSKGSSQDITHWSIPPRRIPYGFAGILIIIVLFYSCPPRSYGQPLNEEKALEHSLANAYLYLATRTTWPGKFQAQSTFVFCINREHSLFDLFSKILPTRKLHQLPIELRPFDEADSGLQRGCHLIALSDNERVNKLVIEHTRAQPVLTVSHEVDISSYGGLVYLAHRTKLEPPKIDFDSLRTSGLKIDAAILDLSRKRWAGLPTD